MGTEHSAPVESTAVSVGPVSTDCRTSSEPTTIDATSPPLVSALAAGCAASTARGDKELLPLDSSKSAYEDVPAGCYPDRAGDVNLQLHLQRQQDVLLKELQQDLRELSCFKQQAGDFVSVARPKSPEELRQMDSSQREIARDQEQLGSSGHAKLLHDLCEGAAAAVGDIRQLCTGWSALVYEGATDGADELVFAGAAAAGSLGSSLSNQGLDQAGSAVDGGEGSDGDSGLRNMAGGLGPVHEPAVLPTEHAKAQQLISMLSSCKGAELVDNLRTLRNEVSNFDNGLLKSNISLPPSQLLTCIFILS